MHVEGVGGNLLGKLDHLLTPPFKKFVQSVSSSIGHFSQIPGAGAVCIPARAPPWKTPANASMSNQGKRTPQPPTPSQRLVYFPLTLAETLESLLVASRPYPVPLTNPTITDNGAYVGTGSGLPAHPAQRFRQVRAHSKNRAAHVMALDIGLPMNSQKQQR